MKKVFLVEDGATYCVLANTKEDALAVCQSTVPEFNTGDDEPPEVRESPSKEGITLIDVGGNVPSVTLTAEQWVLVFDGLSDHVICCSEY